MNRFFTLIAAMGLLLMACQNDSNTQQVDAADTTTNAAATPLQLDSVDRIELFFYSDPKDRSTVQQREVVDTAIIAAFKQNLQQETTTQTECPHDVKMFLVRNGDVFKTIYGATAGSCHYLAYAINGKPFYTKLHQRSKAILDSLRNVAR